jgi:hypothetical protein
MNEQAVLRSAGYRGPDASCRSRRTPHCACRWECQLSNRLAPNVGQRRRSGCANAAGWCIRCFLIVISKQMPALVMFFRMNAETPAQIFRSLKRLPALQRDEAIASTHVGLRVYWKTRFFEALDINQGWVKQFSFIQRGWHRFSRLDHLIYCHIDSRRHPETRSLRRGYRVDLYGSITNVDIVLGIELVLDRFEILPLTLLDRFIEDSRI